MNGKIFNTEKDIFDYKRSVLRQKRGYISFILKVIITFIILYWVMKCIFGIAISRGLSMYPSIKDGDLVLYYRLQNKYSIGDTVVFNYQKEKNSIKRIVAVNGDVVDISDTGKLIINGNVQQEEIFYDTYKKEGGIVFPIQVTKGYIFVLGDNRVSSTDSRDFGLVELKKIKGKIITVIRKRAI